MIQITAKPSNKFILQVLSSCFLLFATSEVIGALVDDSFSNVKSLLLYDAGAKFIIAISMQISSFAEFVRERSSFLEVRSRVFTQVRIPSLVLLSLLMGILLTSIYAIQVIYKPSEYHTIYRINDLNGYFIANVFLDLLCYILLWTRGRDLFFETPQDEISRVDRAFNLDDGEFGRLDDELGLDFSLVNSTDEEHEDVLTFRIRDYLCPAFVVPPSHIRGSQLIKNLTMVASISHLSVDSVKALACLASGLISFLFDLNVYSIYAWSCLCSLTLSCVLVVYPLAKDIAAFSKDVYNDQGVYSKVTAEEDVDDDVAY